MTRYQVVHRDAVAAAGICVVSVMDNQFDTEVYRRTLHYTPGELARRVEAIQAARDWLLQRYPFADDPAAYWDVPVTSAV